MRCLEIGPNKARIPGFETTDITPGPLVDHVQDCRAFTFADGSFDLVYSCHVIEHMEWHQVEATLIEWGRIVKTGGTIEVHTIDALKFMRAIVEYEDTGVWTGPTPGKWCNELHRGDPLLWATGRMLNRAKGGNVYQMHRALITPRYLRECLEKAGFAEFEQIGREDMRRAKHMDWINIGYRAVKQ